MKMLGNLGWRGRKRGKDIGWKGKERRKEEAKVGKHKLLFQMMHEGSRSCPLHPTLLPLHLCLLPSVLCTPPFRHCFSTVTLMKMYHHSSGLIHCLPHRSNPSKHLCLETRGQERFPPSPSPTLSVMFMIPLQGELAEAVLSVRAVKDTNIIH